MSKRSQRPALFAFAAATLTPLALVFTLNLRVDPTGRRSIDEVDRLARIQRDDQLLVGAPEFDQRAWVRARVAGSCPQTLILGSSTLGTLTSAGTSDDLLNAWLTGPSLEDFEAITELLERRRCHPHRIVIGVDPWLADGQTSNDRWRTLRGEAAAYHGGTVTVVDDARQAWALFCEQLNVATTAATFELLRHPPTRRTLTLQPSASPGCDTLPRNTSLRARDGHFERCSKWLLPPDQVEQIADTYLVRDIHHLGTWERLDTERMNRLDRLVARLVGTGALITLVTPPYHPRAYAHLIERPRLRTLLADLDRMLADIAARNGAVFAALRDPSIPGCLPSEFADSHHMLPACTTRVATRLGLPVVH